MDPTERFAGIRPYVRASAASAGASPGKIELNKSIRRLNSLLCQADGHRLKGKPEAARSALDAARSSLVELEAAAEAGRRAFDDVDKEVVAAEHDRDALDAEGEGEGFGLGHTLPPGEDPGPTSDGEGPSDPEGDGGNGPNLEPPQPTRGRRR